MVFKLTNSQNHPRMTRCFRAGECYANRNLPQKSASPSFSSSIPAQAFPQEYDFLIIILVQMSDAVLQTNLFLFHVSHCVFPYTTL